MRRIGLVESREDAGDGVIERIRHAMPTMSRGFQAIARSLVEHKNEAAFLTATQLASRAGVSHATVVRFARHLGFAGYPGLIKAFQGRVTRALTTVERLPEEAGDSLAKRIMQADTANLAATAEGLDPVEFERAVEILSTARRIYVVGLRSAAAVAHLLTFSLSLIRPPGLVIAISGVDYLDQLTDADQADALIAVSFPRYFRQTVEIAAHASQLCLRSVAITDDPLSPLGQLAEATLCAQTNLNTFIESFVAPISVVNALVTATALKTRPEVLARLSRMERFWDQHNIYHAPSTRRWSDDEK
jgi:DNA-binding MurR/RpiR family transcriptional regulator